MSTYIIKCVMCDKKFDMSKTIAFKEANFENGTFGCCLPCYKWKNENSYNGVHLSWFEQQKLKETRDNNLSINELFKLMGNEKFEL